MLASHYLLRIHFVFTKRDNIRSNFVSANTHIHSSTLVVHQTHNVVHMDGGWREVLQVGQSGDAGTVNNGVIE